MFTKALSVALLSLTLSSFSAQALPRTFDFKGNNNNAAKAPAASCAAPTTVTVTLTSTAGAASSTAAAGNNNASTGNAAGNSGTKSGNNAGSSNTGTKAGNNSGSSNTGTKSGSTGSGSQSGSKGASGSSSTTSSAAAAATTSAASNNAATSNDLQTSLTLDSSVIATGFAKTGQETPTAGQSASLTSTNNFINFCATVPGVPITNGQQIKTGSCNPAPMGVIAATTKMPSSKFTFPTNFGTIPANQAFTLTMAINNIETGTFVNAQANYYSAPQHVNAQGTIIGHTHVVIQKLDAIDQTTPADPSVFAFFKGINSAAVNGVVSADVTTGLPAGVYRLASINAAANHQPVLVAVAQHGSLDDMVYFTVSDSAAGAAAGASNSTATATNKAAAAASTTSAAATNKAAASASTTSAAAAATSKAATGTARKPIGAKNA